MLNAGRQGGWLLLMPLVALMVGCGGGNDCADPNTLRGFVLLGAGALDEPDGTLDDDVVVTDEEVPPMASHPSSGRK